MAIEIVAVASTDRGAFARYAAVPMRLEVRTVLAVTEAAAGRFTLEEQAVAQPWVKDYAGRGDEILRLLDFVCPHDAHNTAFFLASDGGRAVGGAMGIRHCPDAPIFDLLGGRDDVAMLADVRVDPSRQRQGIGSRLIAAVADWARSAGMRVLEVETQDTNVPAARLYERMGASLVRVRRGAYGGENARETMLIWSLEL